MQILLAFLSRQRARDTLFGKRYQIFNLEKINAIGAITAGNRQL